MKKITTLLSVLLVYTMNAQTLTSTVTIDPYSTQTVDDAPTRIVSAPFGRTTIQNTGADWIVIN